MYKCNTPHPNKPLGSFLKITNAMKYDSSNFILKPGEVITQFPDEGDRIIWMFTDGACSIVHKYSLFEIAKVRTPFLFGLTEHFNYMGNVSLNAEVECNGIMAHTDLFISIIERDNLWLDIIKIISYNMQTIVYRDDNTIGADNYTKIRLNIMELYDYQMATGHFESVFDFIKNRTRISKSTIYRVLSELKKGGYIEIKNGILISLNKLPLKF